MTTQELWQSQSVDAVRVSPEYLRARASDTIRTARRIDRLRYFALAFAAICCVLFWNLITNPWIRACNVWMIVASVIRWRWGRTKTPAPLAADLGAVDTLRFHRRELERQQATYRDYYRWLVPLYLPAFALLLFGAFQLSGGNGSRLVHGAVVLAVAVTLSISGNKTKAAKLQQEIDLLDLMKK